MSPETISACTTCLSDTYLVWAVAIPAIVAHVMPHLSPEKQAKLGSLGKLANLVSGNYRFAANHTKLEVVSKIAQDASAAAEKPKVPAE